jgi:hypothetical protein
MAFVRKNLLTISGKFLQPVGPTGPCGPTGPGAPVPIFSGEASTLGNIATVSYIGYGNLYPGAIFAMAGLPINTTIVEQTTGVVDGIGNYELSSTGPSLPPGQAYGFPPTTTPPEPATVTCVLSYSAPVSPPTWNCAPGAPFVCPPPAPKLSATIVLTLQSDGVTWSGTWDSSVAEGKVDWVVYSTGSVVAAAQGSFVVNANAANVSVL